MTNRKRIAVLGATGMLGHVMAEYLHNLNEFDVEAIARHEHHFPVAVFDITDFQKLERWLSEFEPQVVVNCIGILVQNANENIANAVLVNSYLPHKVAEIGKRLGFQLIHISTDCVFSGSAGSYREDAVPDGDGPYARTKALGEVINDSDLTIRTSIVGPELKKNGTGLLDWFLKQRQAVTGFDRVFWSGVTTLELAKAVALSIRSELTGLVHLCPPQKISKYELLSLFKEIWSRDIQILRNVTTNSDKSLVNTKLSTFPNSADYHIMLNELKVWMDNHCEYYSHY